MTLCVFSIGNASQRASEPQPETRAVMDLIQERGFTLSVALDGGSLLVTYPYDKPVQTGMQLNAINLVNGLDESVTIMSKLLNHSFK